MTLTPFFPHGRTIPTSVYTADHVPGLGLGGRPRSVSAATTCQTDTMESDVAMSGRGALGVCITPSATTTITLRLVVTNFIPSVHILQPIRRGRSLPCVSWTGSFAVVAILA